MKSIITSLSIPTIVISVVIILIIYTFFSFSLYRLSNKEEKKDNWMSWIPFLNYYYLGNISYNYYYGFVTVLFLCLASTFNNLNFVVACYLIFDFLYSLSITNILKKYTKQYRVFGVLTFLSCTILGGMFIFSILGKKEIKNKKYISKNN